MIKPVTRETELTSEWFTAALRASGVITNLAVRHTEAIRFGHGLLAATFRVLLQYDQPSQAAPASVIVKMPSNNAETRAVAASLEHYKAEVMAYQRLLPSLDVSVPKCYCATYEENTEAFTLVLEDLTPSTRPGNQLAGGSHRDLSLAIGELIKLQSAWWRNAPPFDAPWLFSPGRSVGRSGLVIQAMRSLRQQLSGQLDPRQLEITEKLVEYAPRYYARWFDGSVLQHGDFRLDNMLFGVSSERPPITIIDWQGLKVGPPTVDLCLLLASSLSRSDRRRTERELVQFYYEGLVSRGIRDWTFDDCWLSYRLNAVFPLYANLIVAATMDISSERAQRFIQQNLRNFAALVLDLETLDVLAGELS